MNHRKLLIFLFSLFFIVSYDVAMGSENLPVIQVITNDANSEPVKFNRDLLGVVSGGMVDWSQQDYSNLSQDFLNQVAKIKSPLIRHTAAGPFLIELTNPNVSDRPSYLEIAEEVHASKEFIDALQDPDNPAYGSFKLNFGPHEFLLFAEETNMEPIMQVPVCFPGFPSYIHHNFIQTKLDPETGSNLVKYLNSNDLDDPIVKARDDNGHPEPFNKKYYILGNEEYYLRYSEPYAVLDKYVAMREAYIEQVKDFSAAMRAVDPSIKIGIDIYGRRDAIDGNGQRIDNWFYTNWNKPVLEAVGEDIDFVSVHYYNTGFELDLSAENLNTDAGREEVINKTNFMISKDFIAERDFGVYENFYKSVKEASDNDLEILVGEHGTDFHSNGWYEHTSSLLSAFNTFEHIKYFQKNKFDKATYFLLGGKISFSLIDIDNDNNLRPSYYIFDIFANHFGDQMVETQITNPPVYSIDVFEEIDPYFSDDTIYDVPYLSTMASISEDKKTLYLIVANKNIESSIDAQINLPDFNCGTGKAYTLSGDNIYSLGEAVTFREGPVTCEEGGMDQYTFEAHSITVLEIHSVVADYYVAPDGDDTNLGTFEEPFATWGKLAQVMGPGDLAYIRGGTYSNYKNERYQALFEGLNGTEDNMIRIWAYPGEEPVWDFKGVSIEDPSSSFITPIIMAIKNSNYLHFKGLRVTSLAQPTDTSTVYGWYLWQSSNNIIENCTADHLGGTGFSIHGLWWIDIEVEQTTPSSNNLFLNCDAYGMATPNSQNVADGFDVVHTDEAPNTTFRGCRAWFNSKNGFNLFNSNNMVTFDNCWSFLNGYQEDTEAPVGNGNGFSLGPSSSDMKETHMGTVKNSIAAQNSYVGFTGNTETYSAIWKMYNNFAYGNVVGFSWPFPGVQYVFHNNIAYRNDYALGLNDNYGTWIQSHNTWNAIGYWSPNEYYPPTIDITLTADDFMSLNVSELARPRKADGSLPDVSFGHLKQNSDLIDAGTDVGLPYSGIAPDISPFEYGP